MFERSFFFFARMSCSEQSPFHGQASDRVWSFPICSFKEKEEGKKKNFSERLAAAYKLAANGVLDRLEIFLEKLYCRTPTGKHVLINTC